MRQRATLFCLISLFMVPLGLKAALVDIFPREFEVGGAGGFGVYRYANVSGPAGTASIGFSSQVSGGAVVGENLYRWIGGELRYTYRDGDLNVKSGGQEGSLQGRAHAIHYDFLVHAAQ